MVTFRPLIGKGVMIDALSNHTPSLLGCSAAASSDLSACGAPVKARTRYRGQNESNSMVVDKTVAVAVNWAFRCRPLSG